MRKTIEVAGALGWKWPTRGLSGCGISLKYGTLFLPAPNRFKSWKAPYRSIRKNTSRKVVEHYPNKKNPKTATITS
jgi:hypothetical protein